jgi:hypothetical protein
MRLVDSLVEMKGMMLVEMKEIRLVDLMVVRLDSEKADLRVDLKAGLMVA